MVETEILLNGKVEDPIRVGGSKNSVSLREGNVDTDEKDGRR